MSFIQHPKWGKWSIDGMEGERHRRREEHEGSRWSSCEEEEYHELVSKGLTGLSI